MKEICDVCGEDVFAGSDHCPGCGHPFGKTAGDSGSRVEDDFEDDDDDDDDDENDDVDDSDVDGMTAAPDAGKPSRRRRRMKRCPECDTPRPATIMFGMPRMDAQLEDDLEKGRIVLAGCVISDDDPEWQCLECGVNIWPDGRTQPKDDYEY